MMINRLVTGSSVLLLSSSTTTVCLTAHAQTGQTAGDFLRGQCFLGSVWQFEPADENDVDQCRQVCQTGNYPGFMVPAGPNGTSSWGCRCCDGEPIDLTLSAGNQSNARTAGKPVDRSAGSGDNWHLYKTDPNVPLVEEEYGYEVRVEKSHCLNFSATFGRAGLGQRYDLQDCATDVGLIFNHSGAVYDGNFTTFMWSQEWKGCIVCGPGRAGTDGGQGHSNWTTYSLTINNEMMAQPVVNYQYQDSQYRGPCYDSVDGNVLNKYENLQDCVNMASARGCEVITVDNSMCRCCESFDGVLGGEGEGEGVIQYKLPRSPCASGVNCELPPIHSSSSSSESNSISSSAAFNESNSNSSSSDSSSSSSSAEDGGGVVSETDEVTEEVTEPPLDTDVALPEALVVIPSHSHPNAGELRQAVASGLNISPEGVTVTAFSSSKQTAEITFISADAEANVVTLTSMSSDDLAKIGINATPTRNTRAVVVSISSHSHPNAEALRQAVASGLGISPNDMTVTDFDSTQQTAEITFISVNAEANAVQLTNMLSDALAQIGINATPTRNANGQRHQNADRGVRSRSLNIRSRRRLPGAVVVSISKHSHPNAEALRQAVSSGLGIPLEDITVTDFDSTQQTAEITFISVNAEANAVRLTGMSSNDLAQMGIDATPTRNTYGQRQRDRGLRLRRSRRRVSRDLSRHRRTVISRRSRERGSSRWRGARHLIDTDGVATSNTASQTDSWSSSCRINGYLWSSTAGVEKLVYTFLFFDLYWKYKL